MFRRRRLSFDTATAFLRENALLEILPFIVGCAIAILGFAVARAIEDATILKMRLLAGLLGMLAGIIPIGGTNFLVQLAIFRLWPRVRHLVGRLIRGLVLIAPAVIFTVWQLTSAIKVASPGGSFARFIHSPVPQSVQRIKHGGCKSPFGGVWVVRFEIGREDLEQLISKLKLAQVEKKSRSWLSGLCSDVGLTCELPEEYETFELTQGGSSKVMFVSTSIPIVYFVCMY